MLSHFLVRSLWEFIIDSVLVEMPVERCFQGVAICDVAFSGEHDTRCFPFQVLIFELRRVVSEHFGLFAKEFRQDPGSAVFLRGKRILRSVDEYVFLTGMTMHVYKSVNIFFLKCRYFLLCWSPVAFVPTSHKISHQSFDSKDFRMKFAVWLQVSSIQIIARQRCPIVANNHPIDIYHWDYFENISLSKLYCSPRIAHQKLQISHKIRNLLTRAYRVWYILRNISVRRLCKYMEILK